MNNYKGKDGLILKSTLIMGIVANQLFDVDEILRFISGLDPDKCNGWTEVSKFTMPEDGEECFLIFNEKDYGHWFPTKYLYGKYEKNTNTFNVPRDIGGFLGSSGVKAECIIAWMSMPRFYKEDVHERK